METAQRWVASCRKKWLGTRDQSSMLIMAPRNPCMLVALVNFLMQKVCHEFVNRSSLRILCPTIYDVKIVIGGLACVIDQEGKVHIMIMGSCWSRGSYCVELLAAADWYQLWNVLANLFRKELDRMMAKLNQRWSWNLNGVTFGKRSI